jgi:hypothetical protein
MASVLAFRPGDSHAQKMAPGRGFYEAALHRSFRIAARAPE